VESSESYSVDSSSEDLNIVTKPQIIVAELPDSLNSLLIDTIESPVKNVIDYEEGFS